MTLYTDIEPFCCRVLRARVADGGLPPGDVWERDICTLTVACPQPSRAVQADGEVADVLERLRSGPVASNGVIGMTQERFVQCVRLLRKRGHNITTRMKSTRPSPAVAAPRRSRRSRCSSRPPKRFRAS